MSNIIAKNLTAFDIELDQLSVPSGIIPASGQIELTLWNEVTEIQSDSQLFGLITASGVQLNLNGSDLTISQSIRIAQPVLLHSNLIGFTNDENTQYLLVDGSRAMSNNLDLGGFEILNVGDVDGVDISNHAIRHQNGGPDELTVSGLSGELADIQRSEYKLDDVSVSAITTKVNYGSPFQVVVNSGDPSQVDVSVSTFGISTKSGGAKSATFSGHPRVAVVTFDTPFPNDQYSVATGIESTGSSFDITVEQKTASGFEIHLDTGDVGNLIRVGWIAAEYGEA